MRYGKLKSEIDNSPVLSMFKSITNNISSGSSDEDFMQATLTLNNAQIKDVNTPYVIIPATEVLGYIGVPTSIPVPINITITVNTLAGSYTNVDGDIEWIIAIGSDWSCDLMSASAASLGNSGGLIYFPNYIGHITTATLSDDVNPHVHLVNALLNGYNLDGGIQDNALAIVLKNALGDLADGHADNTLTVTVAYYMHTL